MADLRILHDELLAALAEMEALTARPTFDESEVSRLRYRLSRVSGERRRLVEQLCLSLAGHVTGAQAERLRAVHASSLDARTASNAHIGAWSIREIAADWEGYCRASAAMRAIMRAQIAAEKAALYPRVAAT
jgi:transposase